MYLVRLADRDEPVHLWYEEAIYLWFFVFEPYISVDKKESLTVRYDTPQTLTVSVARGRGCGCPTCGGGRRRTGSSGPRT
jgi:hypothetical protein